MRTKSVSMLRWAPIAMLALLAASCGPSTKMVDVWQDPTVQVTPGEKVLLLPITREESGRRIYEQGMGAELARRGVTVVSGTEMFGGSIPDSNTVKDKVVASGVDKVLVSRVIDVNKEQTYVPGTTYVAGGYPYGGYGYYGYASSSWAVVSDPGYMMTTTTVVIENRLYDVKTAKLVWVGVSHTTDPTSATELMGGLAPAVVSELAARKLLK